MPSGLRRYPDAHCLHFITFSFYRRQMTSLAYPSGRVVNFSYDGAGRLNDVNSPLSGSSYHYYSPEWFYANGSAGYGYIGNGLFEGHYLNNRLQPSTEILYNTNTSTYLVNKSNHYAAGQNNGNISQITDWINSVLTQTFAYDYL